MENKNKNFNKVDEEQISVNQTDLTPLLKANLDYNKKIFKLLTEVKREIRWQQIWGALRFFLIFVPLILGFIYLPPIIKDMLSSYESFLK